jgi:hypothetical protein
MNAEGGKPGSHGGWNYTTPEARIFEISFKLTNEKPER